MKINFLTQLTAQVKKGVTRCTTSCRRLYRGVKLRIVQHRRAKHHKTLIPPYTHCKNCGHELHGMYCHACGQYARDINPNLLNFVWQYCENAFQFDGKFWLTVRRLFACPGRLSTEFMAGHVRRYVFPLKLYMLVAVAFSFVVLGVRKANSEEEPAKTEIKTTAKIPVSLSVSNPESTLTTALKTQIDADSTLTNDQKAAKKEKLKKPSKVDWAASGINFATRLPIAMMFAMPLFAMLSRGFFRRRYRKYLPHLIFSIHIHTVFFIVLSLAVLIDHTLGDYSFFLWAIAFMLLWVIRYGYIAAIRFFADPWWKVLLKNFCLYTLYYIFCIFVIAIGFLFNICYDSWAAGYGFFEPITAELLN